MECTEVYQLISRPDPSWTMPPPWPREKNSSSKSSGKLFIEYSLKHKIIQSLTKNTPPPPPAVTYFYVGGKKSQKVGGGGWYKSTIYTPVWTPLLYRCFDDNFRELQAQREIYETSAEYFHVLASYCDLLADTNTAIGNKLNCIVLRRKKHILYVH